MGSERVMRGRGETRVSDGSSQMSEGEELSYGESAGGRVSLGALQESLRAAEERVALVRQELDRSLQVRQTAHEALQHLAAAREELAAAEARAEAARREFALAKADMGETQQQLKARRGADDGASLQQLLRELGIKLRLVEVAFKLVEAEDQRRAGAYARFAEAERRVLALKDAASARRRRERAASSGAYRLPYQIQPPNTPGARTVLQWQ